MHVLLYLLALPVAEHAQVWGIHMQQQLLYGHCL